MVAITNVSQTPVTRTPQEISNLTSTYVPLDTGQVETKPPTPTHREKGFFEKLSDFFNITIGALFGTSNIDNTPYVNLLQKLNQVEQKGQTNEEKIATRARYLFEESSKVIEYGQKQIEANREPWYSIPPGIGVPISSKLRFLVDDLPEQKYYHNLAVNFWAGVELGIYSPDDKRGALLGFSRENPITKVSSIDDLDNTWPNKTMEPSDTFRVQSQEKIHWGYQIFRSGRKLGVEEWINTARSILPTKIQLVPEGLHRFVTRGVLHSPLQERFGLSTSTQIEGAKRCGVIALNSSIIHIPNQPTRISSKLIRTNKAYEFLESFNGPRINGKTFLESLIELINKQGFAVFEPKGISRYLFDTHLSSGEVYFINYLQIIELKKKLVDDKLRNVNEQDRANLEKECWVNFASVLLQNAVQGKDHWQKVDELKAQIKETKQEIADLTDNNGNQGIIFERQNILSALEEELKNTRKIAYNHIRLIGLDKEPKNGFPNYFKLLDPNSPTFNPQAFYEIATSGVLTSPTVHYYDCHGTPIKGATNEILKICNQFANHPHVRREIARLNKEPINSTTLHQDIQAFRDKGIGIFKEQGVKAYLDWRMLKFLEQRYTKDKASSIKRNSTEALFDCSGRNLNFSKGFIDEGNKIYVKEGIAGYIEFLKNEFKDKEGPEVELPKIIETFLPPNCADAFARANSKDIKRTALNTISGFADVLLEELQKKQEEELKQETCFYPSELFIINNTIAYDNSYIYNSIINIVLKVDDLNEDGQYYLEFQPGREKHSGLLSIKETLINNGRVHTAGDSKADTGMLAGGLERGGACDVVFNLVQDDNVFDEITKQRKRDYIKYFEKNEDLFRVCKEKLGIYILEESDGKYKKIIDFGIDSNSNRIPVYEVDQNGNPRLFTKDEITNELKNKYHSRIVHNISPEAHVRRRAEIFGLLSGEDIEFNSQDLVFARSLYERLQSGESLNDTEKNLLEKYQWAIGEEVERAIIPEDAPRFNTYREWRGVDSKGSFIVYRNKSVKGELVLDRLDGSPPEIYQGQEIDLGKLQKVEIYRNNEGKFVYINQQGKEEECKDLNRLNDHVIENKLLAEPSRVESLLLKVLGKRNSRLLLNGLPTMFNALLKYSGIIMSLGGIIRLISKITGPLENSTYKLGYWMSNGLRAVSALGGALRGELNVHKYHNIAFGEVINIISSFLPNGLKHLGLGFGNFILFLGRGQQRAQLQQRTNNHTQEELKANRKLSTYIDPRPVVRKVTQVCTDWVLTVKNKAKEQGFKALSGELAGSIVSAIFTPIQMIKDVWRDKRLISQWIPRMSEKSGSYYKSAPSAGHLLTLVGALSGLGAILGGTLGRIQKVGEVSESGFNTLGKIAISFANAIPALGIIANAKEVMANPSGLPKIFRDLNNKDVTYDPRKAGLLQRLAGWGFGVVPWFDLNNKYVAGIFDFFTGLYFLGAAEEEKPNTNALAREALRKAQQFYIDPEEKYRLIEFSNAA